MRFIPAALGLFGLLPAAALAQDQQVGARTKAMGGSYTAFEDDPVSVWLNPSGISTQPDALAVAYQTYTTYEVEFNSTVFTGADPETHASTDWNDPALIPSYLGVVFQVGTAENPHAFGFCFTSPYKLRFPVSRTDDDDIAGATFEQVFYRFRAAYGHDLRFRPPGEEGAFTHLSVGLAVDIGISRIAFREFSPDILPGGALDLDLTDTGVGGGAGLLLGLFDNTRNFKVNLGAAYQSQVNFRFASSPTFATQFDWPDQVQAGLTVYLLDGLPLRLTVDAQRIGWGGATQESTQPDGNDFEDVTNFSVGLEYRLKVPAISEKLSFYPRAGYRRFDAPWDTTDKQQLPAIRSRRMIIDTEDDVFNVWSVGLGLGWTGEGGKVRSIDLAFDRGADENGIAMGFSLEF